MRLPWCRSMSIREGVPSSSLKSVIPLYCTITSYLISFPLYVTLSNVSRALAATSVGRGA